MAAADMVKMIGSCKFQSFSCCPLSNKNHKSLDIPCKLQIPKSLSFTSYKPRSDVKPLSSLKSNCVVKFTLEKVPRQILSVSVLVLDEDGELRRKIDDLGSKRIYEPDSKKRINIVLDEVVPLLIENADNWISSRFTVSSNAEESFNKLRREEMDKSCAATKTSNSILCTKVFVDVAIIGVIDDKLKEIHTPGDLEVLLRHLMSMEGVTSAFALCIIAFLTEENRETLKDYYHATA